MKPTRQIEDGRPVAELRRAVKRYGKVTALAGIDFAVRPGEVIALLGLNGAGKATAVQFLLGLARPTASPPSSTCRKARSATISPRPSASSAPPTGSKPRIARQKGWLQ